MDFRRIVTRTEPRSASVPFACRVEGIADQSGWGIPACEVLGRQRGRRRWGCPRGPSARVGQPCSTMLAHITATSWLFDVLEPVSGSWGDELCKDIWASGNYLLHVLFLPQGSSHAEVKGGCDNTTHASALHSTNVSTPTCMKQARAKQPDRGSCIAWVTLEQTVLASHDMQVSLRGHMLAKDHEEYCVHSALHMLRCSWRLKRNETCWKCLQPI